MSGDNKKPANRPTKRLSLYGMKPEDAIRKALNTPPPPKAAKKG